MTRWVRAARLLLHVSTFRRWLTRPVVDLHRTRLGIELFLVVLLLPAAVLGGSPGLRLLKIAVFLALSASLTVWGFARDRLGRRMAWAVRRFRTVEGRRAVVHYNPRLDPFEVALFHAVCEQEIEGLERVFGTRLRAWRLFPSRLRIYLFRSVAGVSRVYGGPCGGFAEWFRWFVVVNADDEWRGLLRHEIAHIFAGRWSQSAPRVLVEGLAVWAQRTKQGWPVDVAARWALPRRADPLDLLLRREWPADPPQLLGRYYVLAGSFTGFLIRRFGLDAYRRFYRGTWTRRSDFARRFERHFGLPLEAAARDWVDGLRRQPPSPIPLCTSL